MSGVEEPIEIEFEIQMRNGKLLGSQSSSEMQWWDGARTAGDKWSVWKTGKEILSLHASLVRSSLNRNPLTYYCCVLLCGVTVCCLFCCYC